MTTPWQGDSGMLMVSPNISTNLYNTASQWCRWILCKSAKLFGTYFHLKIAIICFGWNHNAWNFFHFCSIRIFFSKLCYFLLILKRVLFEKKTSGSCLYPLFRCDRNTWIATCGVKRDVKLSSVSELWHQFLTFIKLDILAFCILLLY